MNNFRIFKTFHYSMIIQKQIKKMKQ
jgi:hypothetical protein